MQFLTPTPLQYTHKTPRNRNAIFQILDCKLANLIHDSTLLLCRLKDNLLALQALILYQIIRLFDGDARQLANAERHLELLDSWTLRLHQNYFQVLSRSEKDSAYSHWVLVESIRRTTMVSVLLRSLFSVMKDGHCQLVPLMCTLPVSNKGRLWKGPEIDWSEENLTNEGEVLTYVEWARQWNAGNVHSIDEYEKLLLVTCRHATGTEGFKVEGNT